MIKCTSTNHFENLIQQFYNTCLLKKLEKQPEQLHCFFLLLEQDIIVSIVVVDSNPLIMFLIHRHNAIHTFLYN
jgi:hypothetical protein